LWHSRCRREEQVPLQVCMICYLKMLRRLCSTVANFASSQFMVHVSLPTTLTHPKRAYLEQWINLGPPLYPLLQYITTMTHTCSYRGIGETRPESIVRSKRKKIKTAVCLSGRSLCKDVNRITCCTSQGGCCRTSLLRGAHPGVSTCQSICLIGMTQSSCEQGRQPRRP